MWSLIRRAGNTTLSLCPLNGISQLKLETSVGVNIQSKICDSIEGMTIIIELNQQLIIVYTEMVITDKY